MSGSDDRVSVALEELRDLKGVWSELSKIWEKIEDLREKPWLSVAPRKVRQELDALLQQLKAFPARLKTYASYEYVQNLLKSYTKVGKGSSVKENQAVWYWVKGHQWKKVDCFDCGYRCHRRILGTGSKWKNNFG